MLQGFHEYMTTMLCLSYSSFFTVRALCREICVYSRSRRSLEKNYARHVLFSAIDHPLAKSVMAGFHCRSLLFEVNLPWPTSSISRNSWVFILISLRKWIYPLWWLEFVWRFIGYRLPGFLADLAESLSIWDTYNASCTPHHNWGATWPWKEENRCRRRFGRSWIPLRTHSRS